MKRNRIFPYTILTDSVFASYNRDENYFCLCKLLPIHSFIAPKFDDSRYFQHLSIGFSNVLQRAFEQKVPVSYVEGDTVYRTVDGKIMERIFDVSPMIPIPNRSYAITKYQALSIANQMMD